MSFVRRGVAYALLALGSFLVSTTSALAQDESLFDLLQPGSRAELGIGGDPFLSPLNDQTGWWSWVPAVPVRTVRAFASAGEPIPRTSTEDDGMVAGRSIGADVYGAAASRWDRTIFLSARIRNPRWVTAWRASSGQARIERSQPRAHLGGRIAALPLRAAVQATLPIWDNDAGLVDSRFFRYGLRVSPTGWFTAQFDLGRERFGADFQSSLYGAEWSTTIRCACTSRRIAARVRAPARIELEYGHSDTRYSSDEGVAGQLDYQIIPDGSSSRDEASIVWRATRRARWLVRWTRADLDIGGNAYWGGQRFGVLNYARGELTSLLSAWDFEPHGRIRCLADFERVWAGLDGRARFEAWPFAETAIDLLGPRRTFRMASDGGWIRSHAAVEMPPQRWGRLRFGTTWHRILPGASLDDWSPAFLAFGATDREHRELEVRHLDLVSAAMGIEWRVGESVVAIEAQQLIAASAHETSGSGGDGGGSSEGGDDLELPRPSLDAERWPAGCQLLLSIAKVF